MLPQNLSKILPPEAVEEMERGNKIPIPRSMKTVERVFPDWIDQYMEYARASASPKIYHIWTALSALASAVQRKVWWDWEYAKLYPNLYIFLTGESGSKKGTALGIAKPIMIDAGVERAPSLLTPEYVY